MKCPLTSIDFQENHLKNHPKLIDYSLEFKKFHSQWAILWPWKSSGLLEFCSQRWVRWMQEWQMVTDLTAVMRNEHSLQNSLTLAAENDPAVLLNSRGPELNFVWSQDEEPEDWRARGTVSKQQLWGALTNAPNKNHEHIKKYAEKAQKKVEIQKISQFTDK